jgi:hypothetical protein
MQKCKIVRDRTAAEDIYSQGAPGAEANLSRMQREAPARPKPMPFCAAQRSRWKISTRERKDWSPS